MILGKISEEHDFERLVGLVSRRLKRGGWTRDSIQLTVVNPGFARRAGANAYVTEVGAQFLRTRDPGLVLDRLLDTIWGIREILLCLRNRPLTLGQIHAKCIKFKADWKNPKQVEYRLRWLRSLGAVTKDGGNYVLAPKGAEAADQLVGAGITQGEKVSELQWRAPSRQTQEEPAENLENAFSDLRPVQPNSELVDVNLADVQNSWER